MNESDRADLKAAARRWHELKTDPDVFDAVADGRKTFEIRLNDRGFQEGDGLLLRRTRYSGRTMSVGMPLVYTGEQLERVVTHVLHGPVYGLADGWAILSITTPKQEAVTAAVVASGETEAQRKEVCAAWNDLPDSLKAHPGLKRLYRALGGINRDVPAFDPDKHNETSYPTIPRVADHLEDGGKGWQPIETAPKDGTEILAWFPKVKLDVDDNLTDEVVGGAMAAISFTGGSWNEPAWLDASGAYFFDDWCFAPDPTLWHAMPKEPADPQRTAIGMRREWE